MFGEKVVRQGLATYFAKYEFDNATLAQFLQEIDNAAKSVGLDRDLKAWSASWLSTSGINIVRARVASSDSKITSFVLEQTCHKAGKNVLRL